MNIETLKKKSLIGLMEWLSTGDFDGMKPAEQKRIRVLAEKKHAWLHDEQGNFNYIDYLNNRINKGMDYLIGAMEAGKTVEDLKGGFALWHKLNADKKAYLDDGWLLELSKENRLAEMRAKEAQYTGVVN